jgi:isopentenyl-diphosphate Delta-isomerase
MSKLILVNRQDYPLGEVGKLEAHLGEGQLHRAFTAILINSKKEILLTQRSLKKPLWPTFWDGSFSSHPWVGEAVDQACQRRSLEELGVKTADYQPLFTFYYQSRWSEHFSEHEYNHILFASYDGELSPEPEEISAWKWLGWEQVQAWMKGEPHVMAPWWQLIFEKIEKNQKLQSIFL